MRILLIQPMMNMRPMDTRLKTRMSPSLALLTLLRLTPEGNEVILINENLQPLDFDNPADLVGITVTLDVMPRACRIAEEFQRRGIPVVAGGIHITACPEECLPHFDAVCVGPAERVWARMVQDAAGKQLNRIYRDMENFRGEELASPLYGGIDTSPYLYSNVITTSHGCPNRCDFCYNSCKNRLYVRRPIPDVLSDIKDLKTRHILFIDDNFIGDASYTRLLLQELRGMNLKWSAAVTTKILDFPELLDLMEKTGCQSLFIGFETLNNSALQGVHKDNRFERYEALIKAIHDRGIMINASLVFGLDGDGPEVFPRTLDWLVKNRIETMTAHILTPYPGTELYRRMEAEGRITQRDLSQYNTAHVVFAPRDMTAEELYNGYLWMYRRFYAFRSILRRMPQMKKQRMSYLLFNLLYRKFGRLTAILAWLVSMGALGRWAARLSYRIR
ncbi:B12-binding domain-containing radical SAM protein [Papillibacter cinnamivorans]|uniref:Radical SAM superfamily enzyme YgiQ, UPF0313 family n=1 Tax=Papillibacter cinnamivorans DSM 12816 TaxID=1122930 RepID=A0A1W2AGD7_9FIRM|nr:radical SAM protein [Papillibacter cinnamivorans]SMC59765.1 Radical SAM superfamily enzyme YgiQ, UPF0313 family [Papillibacter cinnamivorans DSM 12816]